MTITSSTQPAYPSSDQNMALTQLMKRIAGRMEQGFCSQSKGYGLRRDLQQPVEKPEAKIPLYVRPLDPADLDILLPLQGDIPPAEAQQIRWRRHFYKKMPEGCYVAVDQRSDTPCYMQWLAGARDNAALARFKCFPRLAEDEALLEQAYTIPSHRGLGIMSAAMAGIAEYAANLGARYVLTFVPEDGAASMKACGRAGFTPHLLHRRIQIGYGSIILNSFRPVAP